MLDKEIFSKYPQMTKLQQAMEIAWINPDQRSAKEGLRETEISVEDVNDAERRLLRFAPFIQKCFPETEKNNGIIESVLTPVSQMQKLLNEKYHSQLSGCLLLKQDSHLPIAGSIKARGGIYEVLKHTEELAIEYGILEEADNYEILASEEARNFFHNYTIQVGSTGNLGLSIGIMSAVIGYQVKVHMSADARQWKKELLRSYGVEVIEYESDYSEAVKNGRALSEQDPRSYFVDDENSVNLFLGYAVAARRLKKQLDEQKIMIDSEHPLFVYIPCGVGGAPGGVTFGLKQVFGDFVHCFFVEPVQAPCMLLGMLTGKNDKICVQDVGLTGITDADGLAVGRPSGFVGKVMKPLLAGEFTIKDAYLYEYMRDLLCAEKIFLEPSACAAFQGPVKLMQTPETMEYLIKKNLLDKMNGAFHVAWATGGNLVPREVRKEYENTFPEA